MPGAISWRLVPEAALVIMGVSRKVDARRCNETPGRYTSSHGISHYPRAMEDAELARAIARAATAIDAVAEAEFCRRFAPRVRLYGLRHLRDRHAAADLVQQVLMTTLERLRAGSLRDPERLASFICGMCRMTVHELRR